MATTTKIPSQGNLVDLLAAFGRGALGTLTDRFGQYDAALESVATHEANIGKLIDIKTEWFDAGYITADTCYNILTGAQSSVTLPLDVSQLIRSVKADPTETRRYAGVRFTVQGKEDVCLYLKFAAISPYADSGAVVFEDLQFCYSPTEEGVEDIDVRYKVRTDKSTGGIVLEKVEASAGSQPQEWIIPTLDNGDILGSAFGGGYYEENGFVFDESKVKVGDIVKVTDCAEATLTVIGIHAWEIYTGYKKNVYHLFLSREEKPAIVYQMCLDGQVGYFNKLFDASTYAKKTDIRYPWLEIDIQDDLYDGIANLNPGEKFELVPQSTDINPNEDLSKYCGLRLHDTNDNVWYLPWAYILDDRSEYDTCPFMFNGKTLRAEVIGASVWFINNDPDLSDYAKKTDIPEKPFTFVVDGDAAGYDVDGLVSGVAADFDIALSTAIKNQLTQALYKITIAENAAAGTAMSVPDTDIVNLMPRFTLLLGKGNFGYRFYASGTQNESGLIHFKGTISLNAKSTEWVAVCDLGSASKITFKRIM